MGSDASSSWICTHQGVDKALLVKGTVQKISTEAIKMELGMGEGALARGLDLAVRLPPLYLMDMILIQVI